MGEKNEIKNRIETLAKKFADFENHILHSGADFNLKKSIILKIRSTSFS